MNPNSVRFACTALAGVNKVGNLKQDENGYYPMVVGGLGTYNSSGQFYDYERAKAIFEGSGQLMRRVSKGALRGEYGHPKMAPGQSNDSFVNRVMSIYEENTCCHHKELELDFENVKDENGRPIIAIVSKVCPSGPLGHVLERQLKNKDENVCFSIRAFTDDFREGGRLTRVLKTVVTFDYVNEPGIAVANKYKSPALESMDDRTFSRGDVERGMSKTIDGMATESVLLTGAELFNAMGWNVRPGDLPASMRW
jgi:hypothetical protein